MLREDIADAACGDPAKRINSAADLAERLLTLEQRRIKRDELEAARMRAQIAERKLAETRSRRPWVVFAVIALTAGLAVSFASTAALFVNATMQTTRPRLRAPSISFSPKICWGAAIRS